MHTVNLHIKASYDDATYDMAVRHMFGQGQIGPLSKEDVVDMIESTVDDTNLSVEITPI
jgi:hypothetical protein